MFARGRSERRDRSIVVSGALWSPDYCVARIIAVSGVRFVAGIMPVELGKGKNECGLQWEFFSLRPKGRRDQRKQGNLPQPCMRRAGGITGHVHLLQLEEMRRSPARFS
jgi:hypothetical protein